MVSFQIIQQCLKKLNADSTFLILTIAAIQPFGATAWALPTVISFGHHTDRFGPNSIPGAPAGGDHVQISAVIDSSDTVGSPTISVEAIQGDATITLDYIGPQHTLFQGVHLYYKFIDFDPTLTGSWKIVPSDSTGIGPATVTDPIVDPEFLPLVDDVTVQGTPLGARVDWTLPNLDGFDVDAQLVRVMEANSGGFVFEEVLPVQTTSYEPPAGVLQVGVDYVYWIVLGDSDSFDAENLSWAVSEPFRFTVAGDFNTDGTVDAADYVVWRNGLGTSYSQSAYQMWRANFGTSLNAGSGSAQPSAESLPAAVPEPGAAVLFTFAIAAYFVTAIRELGADRFYRRSFTE